jgi:ParB-like chromosome segregation protein Spo0J
MDQAAAPDSITADVPGLNSTELIQAKNGSMGDHRGEQFWRAQLTAPAVRVNICDLVDSDSPRAALEDGEHIKTLAETDAELPPILVHRETMRVIDGMHRLRAAQLRGERTISTQFFTGTDEDAFVLAVAANIAHGLPLSLTERKAAAHRIVTSHPSWSDRRVAAVTGLSHKTVGALRRRSPGDFPQATARLGRDGRVHPLATADGRRRAGELLIANPRASMEEVARRAEISLTTAKDVRRRLRSGQELVPVRHRTPRPAAEDPPHADRRADPDGPATLAADPLSAVRALSNDPSLKFTQAGRLLLSYLHLHMRTQRDWDELADMLPAHCLATIAELADRCAQDWQLLSARVARRTR